MCRYVKQDANAKMRAERVKELKDAKDKAEAKSKKQIEESNKKIQALQKRVCLFIQISFFLATVSCMYIFWSREQISFS